MLLCFVDCVLSTSDMKKNIGCNFVLWVFGVLPGVFHILRLAPHPLNLVAVGGEEGHIRRTSPPELPMCPPVRVCSCCVAGTL